VEWASCLSTLGFSTTPPSSSATTVAAPWSFSWQSRLGRARFSLWGQSEPAADDTTTVESTLQDPKTAYAGVYALAAAPRRPRAAAALHGSVFRFQDRRSCGLAAEVQAASSATSGFLLCPITGDRLARTRRRSGRPGPRRYGGAPGRRVRRSVSPRYRRVRRRFDVTGGSYTRVREAIAMVVGERSKMSASQYRGQLRRKRKQRIEAGKKASDYRGKEAAKRSAAAKARAAAGKTKSGSTAASKTREAERAEKDAAALGKEAARWEEKASRYSKEEAALEEKVAKAEQSEADATERRRKREQLQADRRLAAERASFERRIDEAESEAKRAVRELRAPKPEKLRVLILGAGSAGDLRVGREQKRIRTGAALLKGRVPARPPP
jgi:hypothetical protein